MTADEVIRLLALQPHPEGGYYRETFRDSATTAQGRNASTAIYFLLREDEISRWHRVDASEIWLWHGGEPLELSIIEKDGEMSTLGLSGDLASGDRPQAVVPANAWQQARSTGAWSLVSCTVAPGFTFDGFEMAPAGFTPSSVAS